MAEARRRDDTEEYTLGTGQTAGLISELKPAAQVVREIVEVAESIVTARLASMVARPTVAAR
jgi:NAD(P)H-dependent flavin oxidoreductase YrpB (nitropropane dioxygenase family)